MCCCSSVVERTLGKGEAGSSILPSSTIFLFRLIAADGNTATESRPGSVAVTATYDGFGRLVSYDRSNTGQQDYTYNGLMDRVKVVKPTATRHFVYDSDGRVMAEYGLDASDVKAEFIWANPSLMASSPFGGGDHIGGFSPLAVATPDAFGAPELRWVHGNHLGVPLVTTNASGSPIAPQNDYMLPGFPGQSMALTDFYYNRHRDYDPVTGRYIQADPLGLGGDVNPYVYALSNPVNMVDPDGRIALPAPGAHITVIFGGLAAVLASVNARNALLLACGFGQGLPPSQLPGLIIPAGTPNLSGLPIPELNPGPLHSDSAGEKATPSRELTDDEREALAEAGKALDQGGRTKAGRAQEKHGSRPGSAFPPTKGPPSAINDQGQRTLEDILNAPGATIEVDANGTITVWSPDGRGAQWRPNGEFKGLREPER